MGEWGLRLVDRKLASFGDFQGRTLKYPPPKIEYN